MHTLDELKQENLDIANLCEVLAVLIEHKELRNNPFVCELVSRFREQVWTHLVFEDNPIYAELARQPNHEFNEIASHFLQGSQSVKKRFANYVKCWCAPADDAAHDRFVSESREMLRLIMDRVQYENDTVFPLIAKHQQQIGENL